MGLSCADYSDGGDGDWWWELSSQQIPLATKRSRKCCSCDGVIKVGDACSPVHRSRPPKNDIEERIHGDEVPMSTWYLCEKCSDLAASLTELGFCFTLGGQSIAEQINEYREAERAEKEWQAMKAAQPSAATGS